MKSDDRSVYRSMGDFEVEKVERFAEIPFYFLALLSFLLYLVPSMRTSAFEMPHLLLAVNVFFVAPVSLWVSVLALRAYLASGIDRILYAGAAVLVFGIASLVAALHLLEIAGMNHAVTIHDTGILCASVLHLTGCLQNLRQKEEERSRTVRTTVAIVSYGGVLAMAGLAWAAVEGGLLPPFVVPEGDITPIRLVVIALSILLFALSALLADIEFQYRRAPYLRLYCFGLALIALGLSGVALAISGSVLSWVGRSAQYLGNFYFFFAAMMLVRDAKRGGLDMEEAAVEFFRKSEAHYRSLVEASTSAIISVDSSGRVSLWNRAAEDCFGVPATEAAGISLPEAIAPPETREALRNAILRDEASRFEMTLQRKNGDTFPADMSVYATGWSRSRASTLIIRDISERMRTEEQLASAVQRLSAHMENSPLAVIEFDSNFRVIRWSKEACRLFGWSAEEILNRAVEEIRWVHDDDAESVRRTSEDLFSGRKSSSVNSNRNYRKDGKVVSCEWYNSAFYDSGGQLTSILSLVLDITERRRIETALLLANEHLEERVRTRTEELVALTEQLLSSREKLRALAMELSRTQERERKRIAVALHDEVAQTLAAAKMRLDLLQAQGSDEHFRNNIAEARELLGKSIRETRSIMTDLSPPLLFDMGLDAACQSLAEQQASRHGIQVRCDIPRSFQEVSQELRMFLFQAIRELLANAAKHGSARNVLVAVEERNGNLLVRVRDDGNGFDTRTLGFPGESGGFGLFSLRERLAVFDGSMKIDSNPGEGTEVTILMPHGADERRKKKRFPRKRKP